MAFVQTAIGDHHFLFFAHFLDQDVGDLGLSDN